MLEFVRGFLRNPSCPIDIHVASLPSHASSRHVTSRHARFSLSIFSPSLSPFLSLSALCAVRRSGKYILGFRVDPASKLNDTYKEIKTLYDIYSVNPILGVKYVLEDKPQSLSQVKVERQADDTEIVQAPDGNFEALAAYYAEGTHSTAREPVYSPELGLAIEKLRHGTTIDDLWTVVNN